MLAASVDRSLSRLKTDRIDVMLLHSCDLATLEHGEAIGALVESRRAGKIGFVGYSGDNETAAYAAGHPEIAVIETSVNLCDQANLDAVLPKARENDLGVIAKRPIANAAWKDVAEQRGVYAGYAQTYRERLAKMNLTPAALGFDGDPDHRWPEIALRFTLSQPGVHTAIIGTTDPEHARANLQRAAKGPLPEAVVAAIRDAFHRAEAADGRPWIGQT
jgi:aryl-alcohol dehydrogenase-like predicted oxidoreductase